MKRSMRGFLHLIEGKKTDVVGLTHFFKRPAHAHVTRQSLAAIWRPFKGGNGGGHWSAPVDCMTPPIVTCVIATFFLRVRCFLCFPSRGRTTGSAPDNLPRLFGHGIRIVGSSSAKGRFSHRAR